jgi:hypothetical protein
MLGHGKYGATALDHSVGRSKTIAYGGTALDDEQAYDLLTSAGLTDVRTIPTTTRTSARNDRQLIPAVVCAVAFGRKAGACR